MVIYPLVICYVAIENGPVEIVDFPINSTVMFHVRYVNVYQRVFPLTYGNNRFDPYNPYTHISPTKVRMKQKLTSIRGNLTNRKGG